MTLFIALGIMLGFYTVYAAMTGKVFAKSGPWGRITGRRARQSISG